MLWPARGPNPIDHVWDMLGRRSRDHPNRSNDWDNVGRLLVKLWNEMDYNNVDLQQLL